MTRQFTLTLTILLVLTACSGGQKTEQSDNQINTTIDTILSDKLQLDSTFVLTDKLPTCIDYTESLFDETKDAYYYEYAKKDKKYFKGKNLLSTQFLKQHLFRNTDTVYIQNIWDGEIVGKESLEDHLSRNEYYSMDTILNAKTFLGVVYERIEGDGSEKFFYTFTKAGDLISKIPIAFYMQSGTYENEDGGRSPWWATKYGCIEKNLIITTDNGQGQVKKFKIQSDGIVREIK